MNVNVAEKLTQFPELFRIVKSRRTIRLKLMTEDGSKFRVKFNYNSTRNSVFCEIKGKAKRAMTVFLLDATGEIHPPNNQFYKHFIDLQERTAAYHTMILIEQNSVEYFAEYGKRTGICGVCGRTLTNDDKPGPDGLTSVDRGIGPVCAELLGLFTNARIEPAQYNLEDILDSLPIEENADGNDTD